MRQSRARHPCGAARRGRGLRWTARTFLRTGGVLVVGVALGDWPLPARAQSVPGAERFLGKSIDPKQVDAFLAIHADSTVTMFTGKVDLGTGARIALRQMVAEELDVPPARITMIEGDTALTPDQARTAGSYGIARGGMQLRQAAATARQALLALAAQKLGRPVEDLEIADGVVRVKGGGASVRYGELVGDKALGVAVDPKAPLNRPRASGSSASHCRAPTSRRRSPGTTAMCRT